MQKVGKKFIPEYNCSILRMFDQQKIIIENYHEIIDISPDSIIVDQYIIVGEILRVTRLDQVVIEIYGKIKEIIIT